MKDFTAIKEMTETVTVLKRLKEECKSVWEDVKAEGTDVDKDVVNKRSAFQAYTWYVSVCEMLDMYEDLLSEINKD